jgi:hypothetical protein
MNSKSANVIDLEAFRQRKSVRQEETRPSSLHAAAVLMPVWFCWVPIYPFIP